MQNGGIHTQHDRSTAGLLEHWPFGFLAGTTFFERNKGVPIDETLRRHGRFDNNRGFAMVKKIGEIDLVHRFGAVVVQKQTTAWKQQRGEDCDPKKARIGALPRLRQMCV